MPVQAAAISQSTGVKRDSKNCRKTFGACWVFLSYFLFFNRL